MRFNIKDLPTRYQEQIARDIAKETRHRTPVPTTRMEQDTGHEPLAEQTVNVAPIGKPRMTSRDKWHKRPCVDRYWRFKDAIKSSVTVPDNASHLSWIAYFEMPKSWSKSKKRKMSNTPHRCKPDRDNVDKAILDALFIDDSKIYSGSLLKMWDDGHGPRIVLTIG